MTEKIKRHDRQNRKNAIPMNKLVFDTLSRHGIAKQVQSAMIVKEGNAILDQIVEPDYRDDIRVLSYSSNMLVIVCRHSASMHYANSIRSVLQEKIEKIIPDAVITKINVRTDQRLLDSHADILI